MNKICLERDQELRDIHLGTASTQFKVKSQYSLILETQKGLHLPQPQDSFPDAGEARHDFWSMSGKLHIPPSRWIQGQTLLAWEEESFPFPLKYIDVSRTTHTNFDVMQESRIDDFWKFRWIKRFVRFLDRLHSVYSIKWETSRRICVVLPETDNSGEEWQGMPSWRRSINGATEKPKLDNARKITRNLFHWHWGHGVQGNH